MTGSSFGLTPQERLTPQVSAYRDAMALLSGQIRVALPCVVVSFDATKQTVSVQPCINEVVRNNGVPQSINLPQLDDVLVCIPRAGGFSLTFPIQAGDECLVIFADMCIDQWYQAGGPNNYQIEKRRHDLSDGIAIFGIWSQKRLLSGYSTTKSQLRSDDGTLVVELGGSQITVTAPKVVVNSSGDVDINATGNVSIQSVDWLTHIHSGVSTGGSDTGPVVP